MRLVFFSIVSLSLFRCTHDRDNPYDPGGHTYVSLSAPADLTARPLSPTSVALEWTDNNNREEGVLLYRGTDSMNLTLIATLPVGAKAFTDTVCRSYTQYYYKIGVFDKLNETVITKKAIAVRTQYVTPLELPENHSFAQPAGFAITRTSPQTVTIVWNSVNIPTISGFVLLRGKTSTSLMYHKTLPAAATSYTDTLPAEPIVYYGLHVFDSCSISNAAIDSITQQIAPNNLSLYLTSGKNIRLTWQNTDLSTDSIQVERRINKEPWVAYQKTWRGATFWLDTTLASFRTYYYRVYAFSGTIRSATSNDCSLSVKSIRPPLSDSTTLAYYSMNETSGDTLYDASAGQQHGLLKSALRVPGKFGNGLSFSENSYATANHPFVFSDNELMVEFWMKPKNQLSTGTGYQGLISTVGGPFSIYYFDGTLFADLVSAESSHYLLDYDYDFLPNKWYHIVLSYAATT
ncbi:MAG: LamG-like jellyroll fold domain-containing protein, partial [Fibrobacterota bacterium]